MRFSSFATYLAVASAVNAKAVYVTQTLFTTEFGEGPSQSSLPASTLTSSTVDFSSASVSAEQSQSSSSGSSSQAPASQAPASQAPASQVQVSQAGQGTTTTQSSAPAISSAAQETSAAQTPSASTASSSEESSSSSESTSSGGSEVSGFAEDILDAHNKVRSSHGASPLTWDKDLANKAQNYANSYSCGAALSHHSSGENLAYGAKSGSDAVHMWASEEKDYDSSGPSEKSGHYSQIVWKGSKKLGCGVKDCSSSGYGQYVDCLYDPAGNVEGEYSQNVAN